VNRRAPVRYDYLDIKIIRAATPVVRVT